MTATVGEDSFKVWACDNMVYGPIALSTLIDWVTEERVLRDTWILSQTDNLWHQAKDFPALGVHFRQASDAELAGEAGSEGPCIGPEELRAFESLAGLSNEELAQFLRFGELRTAKQGEVIIKKGDPGDAVFFVLTGEVRARLVVGLVDTTLCRIAAGEFFGEMSMFTQTARSADVVGESDSRLFRLSAQAFLLLIKEIPRLAGPILFAISRTMALRIAETNRQLQREVASGSVWT